MKHRRVRYVGVAAIDPPRRNQRHRRLLRTHRANLYRRGVRAQETPVRKIEGVVHGARRMVRRNIERLEVMEVVLDLRPRGYLKARLHENPLDAQTRASDRMYAALLLPPARQRH